MLKLLGQLRNGGSACEQESARLVPGAPGARAQLSQYPPRRWLMLKLALTFFLIGLVAVLLGFTGIAGASFAIAKFFAVLFGILFLVFLILGLSATRRIA